MKSLSAAFLTWSAAGTLAKALRLLEVKEEKVVRRKEYPLNGISVPGPYGQQCVVLHTFVLGFKIARGAVCLEP